MHGSVPRVLASPTCRVVPKTERHVLRRGVLDDRQELLLAGGHLRRDHGAGRLTGGDELPHGLDELVAPLALGETGELPKELGDLLTGEENPARVPALRDAPEDMGMVLLALEGDAAGAKLLELLLDRRGLNADVPSEIGLLPRPLIEERLEDRGDGLALAPLSHGRECNARRAISRGLVREGEHARSPLQSTRRSGEGGVAG